MGITAGLGGYLGSGKEEKGYEDARDLMRQLGQEAGKASQYADPYQQYRAGNAATLNGYVTGTKSIQTDPGYQFAQQEGQNAVGRAAAARGMNNSGNVMAALQSRGQDLANQQYGSIIDRLTNLSGATAQNAIAGGQIYGNMMTTSLTGQADAEIGIGAAQGRGTGALYNGIEDTAYRVMNMFPMTQVGDSTGSSAYGAGGKNGQAGGSDSGGGMAGGFDFTSFFGGGSGGGMTA